jgi:hypothetical protein
LPWYRTILICDDVPIDEGAAAARDIAEEFQQRPWHQNVTCDWDGRALILRAENHFDRNGLALTDEFSDLISASIRNRFDGDIRIVSIEELD